MVFSMKKAPKYSTLQDEEILEHCEDLRLGYGEDTQKVQVSFSWLTLALLFCIPFTSITTFSLVKVLGSKPTTTKAPIVACVQPPIRREWRTLDRSDRVHYIEAVKCLATLPSTMNGSGTLYDDFPYVHQKTAPSAHQSAPFLPWHRFYIHSYEMALKERCAYTGVLPYWDWSQDSHDFSNSPIWDAEYGFGGDGGIDGTLTVGNGRCVETGPFAGLQALYYDDKMQPHCLSRGFAQGDDLRELTELVHPDAIESLMEEEDFEKFAPELERRAHRFVSHSIRGDFSKYTGPYDPVFFLHHTNLDRLWTKWQHKHDITAYGGNSNMTSTEPASIMDMLDIGGLLESVPVAKVMNTQSGMFCYQY